MSSQVSNKRTMRRRYVNFCHDVVYAILLRLPAKDLIRFKAVCKEWRSIISDPGFAQAHLAHSVPDLLFSVELDNRRASCYTLNMQDNKKRAQKLHILVDHLGDRFYMRSFCDGLLLLQSNLHSEHLTIYNPVTRRSKRLPPPQYMYSRWGLVRDTSIGKYKVFGVDPYLQTIGVFTQGGSSSGDWRYMLKPRKKVGRTFSGPICIGNEFYWSEVIDTHDVHGGKKEIAYIYSIDIAKEELKEVEVKIIIPYYYDLAEVEGSLCVVNGNFPRYFETWVLTDKENNSWTRHKRISCRIIRSNLRKVLKMKRKRESWTPEPILQQIYVTGDIASDIFYIFVRHEGHLYLYDGKNKELSEITYLVRERYVTVSGTYGFHINSVVNWE